MALIAYAAFALACITGVMYLLQERLLKRHRIGGLFYQLPPIQDLAKSIRRLALLGLVLLSAALAMSLALHQPTSNPKVIFAWAVWVLYGFISIMMWRHILSPRQTAWLAVVSLPVFSGVAPWVDYAGAVGQMTEYVMSATQWAHVGTSLLIWMVLPLLIGARRITRAEVTT